MSICATSASWGSSGLGSPRSSWRERRVVLMLSTGDQADPNVSRQIAPFVYELPRSAVEMAHLQSGC